MSRTRVSKAPDHKAQEGRSVTGDSVATWKKTSGLLPLAGGKKKKAPVRVREVDQQTQKLSQAVNV